MAREKFQALADLLVTQVRKSLAGVRGMKEAQSQPWSQLGGVLGQLLDSSELIQKRATQHTNLSWQIASELVESTRKLCESFDHTSASPSSASVLISKLSLLTEMLQPSLSMPEDDLMNLERSHPRWRSLWEKVEYVRSVDSEALKNALDKITQRMIILSASFSTGLQCRNPRMQRILTTSSLLYYALDHTSAWQVAQENAAIPSPEFIRLLLEMSDSKLLSNLFDSNLAPISVSKKIFVPRVSRHLSDLSNFSGLLQPPSSHIRTGSFAEFPCVSRPSVAIRIISPYPVPALFPLPQSDSSWTFCCCSRPVLDDERTPDKIILHIHGGGWLCMSSHSHENYTRKWAIGTNTMVISVDYRLAPEFPYPNALNDVWDAYIWVLKYAKMNLGVNPKKIIVTGDSAGGNLALALTLKCLEMRVRPPDGLLLSYPTLNMDMTFVSPSYLASLDDVILSHGMMLLCAHSYNPNGIDPRSDPLLSPLFASDELLKQLPPVRIIVGTKDPLLDDSWRFFEKLKQLGNDVKMTVFEGPKSW